MSKARLSICIPTYNFGEFIGETLSSIADQATDELEIVVLDGGSLDNTREVVEGYQRRLPGLRYHRLEKRGGIDRDMAKSVELAQGEYCWLFSADDAMQPGAVGRILEEIKSGCDIYLCNRTVCDRELSPISDEFWLSKRVPSRTFDFGYGQSLIEYLDAAESIGGLFSYMSSIVVNKGKWAGVGYDEKFTGSHYAHAFRLLSMATRGGTLKYIREPLLFCRSGNDSFATNGPAQRMLIDLKGYRLIADSLSDELGAKVKIVMQKQHAWYLFPGLRNDVKESSAWREIEENLRAFGYSHGKLALIRIIGSSGVIVRVARAVRNQIMRARKWARRARTYVSV